MVTTSSDDDMSYICADYVTGYAFFAPTIIKSYGYDSMFTVQVLLPQKISS